MIHGTRKLANLIRALSQGGTPLRHARGVVVSSNIGETVVTLDGGSTNITAYNYGHSQSFPASTVVDVLLVDGQAYILGAYSGDVQVGGLLLDATGPASTTLFTTSAVAVSSSAGVIAGHQYMIHGRALGTQQTAAAIVELLANTDDGVVSGIRFISETVGAGGEKAGGASTIYTPASTRTTTFSLNILSNAGDFSVAANAVELIVTRVA